MTDRNKYKKRTDLFKGSPKQNFKRRATKEKERTELSPEKTVQTKQSKANLGWLFNKGYYRELENHLEMQNGNIFDRINNELIDSVLSNYKNEINVINKNFGNEEYFDLKTIYPGLLIGTGSPHETGSLGEFKLGFHFDHTTGLPVIPSSSIKGKIRSAFDHPDYINSLIKKSEKGEGDLSENTDQLDINQIDELKNDIFEGKFIPNNAHTEIKDKRNSIYQRDIFFDAVIIKAEKRIFAEDFITPHKSEFKNPIPLKFIKISPGVTFRFRFRLLDRKINKDSKLHLFKKIILDQGIGAKTNVGYGRLVIP